jgi:HEAT repeat protein
MTEQDSPVPEIRLNRPGDRRSNRTAFGIVLMLMLILWLVVMVFRWELRARWWAYEVARCESAEDRDFYLTRLASIRDKSFNAVSELVNDDRPEIRSAGVTVLRYCEGRPAAVVLIRLLADPSPEVAVDAATALAQRRDAASYIPELRSRLLDNPGRSSWGTAIALGRIRRDEAEDALKTALARAADPDLKAQIIDSLGMAGCEEAVPMMIDSLTDDRPVQILPQSQQSAQRAINAVRPDFLARGADPDSALKAASTAPTVSAVAARWVRLLGGLDAETAASQPADRRADTIRRLQQAWSSRQAASRPSRPA